MPAPDVDEPVARTVDVTVVGAGPAGLMAAAVAARHGASVLVIEACRTPGRKFLLAGRSGLNVTNSESTDRFLAQFGPNAPSLAPMLAAFTVDDLCAWSASLGQPTIIGSSGRVFPEAWRAAPLLRSWLASIAAIGVEIRTETTWTGIDRVGRLLLANSEGRRERIATATTVLACGGASWPSTGSNGAWVGGLEPHGVRLVPFRPANAGLTVAWSNHMRRFVGQPIKDVLVAAVTTGSGESPSLVATPAVRGDLVVVGSGLQGTPAYTVSSVVAEAVGHGRQAELRVDLRPDLDVDTIAERIARRRSGESTTNVLRRALRLSPVAIALANEADRAPALGHDLAQHLKAVPVPLTGTEGLRRAISSSGGIAWDELDEALRIRQLPSVFAAGEMIAWDAPTGGYLLHACLATGAWAGHHAALDALDARASRQRRRP